MLVSLGVLVTLAVIAGGLGAWTVTRSFPTLSGEISVPGLDSEVTVYRDDAGIPQIVAETASDLFRAQGYVHAQDRFWEMDFRRHVTSGRLAELFGESQVDTDVFIRTLGWRAIAEQEVALLDPATLGYYQSYADGVNAYLDTHSGADLSLEYAVLGFQNSGYTPEKWTPADSVAWLKAMAWDLRSNLDDEIDRALLSTDFSASDVDALHPSYSWATQPTIIGGMPAVAATPPATDDGTDAETTAAQQALVSQYKEQGTELPLPGCYSEEKDFAKAPEAYLTFMRQHWFALMQKQDTEWSQTQTQPQAPTEDDDTTP